MKYSFGTINVHFSIPWFQKPGKTHVRDLYAGSVYRERQTSVSGAYVSSKDLVNWIRE